MRHARAVEGAALLALVGGPRSRRGIDRVRQVERGGHLRGHAHGAVRAGRDETAGALAASERRDRLGIHGRDRLETIDEALAHAERLGVAVAGDRLDAEPARRGVGAELARPGAEHDERRRREWRWAS